MEAADSFIMTVNVNHTTVSYTKGNSHHIHCSENVLADVHYVTYNLEENYSKFVNKFTTLYYKFDIYYPLVCSNYYSTHAVISFTYLYMVYIYMAFNCLGCELSLDGEPDIYKKNKHISRNMRHY